MQIWDAAGTASALYDLITHNRFAGQLAEAWDNQHPSNLPLKKACEKVKQDWGKMVWLSRAENALEVALLLVVVIGLLSIVASLYMVGWFIIVTTIFFVALFIIVFGSIKKTHEKIARYRRLGDKIATAHGRIRTVYDRFQLYGDVADMLQELDNRCLEIVSREMLGETSKCPSVFFDRDSLRMKGYNLGGVAKLFYQDIKDVGEFGLVTTDLKHHIGIATERWLKMVSRGEILTDFQI